MSSSLGPHGLYSLWNSSGQNTGVGSLSLLQGIFPMSITGRFFTSWATREAHKGGKSKRIPEKHLPCFMTILKPLTMWITTNCGKLLKRWEYQTTLPASWKIFMQVRKQQLEPGMEQWAGSKLRKEYVKAVYCHPVYLTYMQSTSCKMLGWMKYKLESRFREKYQ